MSEKRKCLTFTPEQKAEIVLAGPRGDRIVRDVCVSARSPRRCTAGGVTGSWRAARLLSRHPGTRTLDGDLAVTSHQPAVTTGDR